MTTLTDRLQTARTTRQTSQARLRMLTVRLPPDQYARVKDLAHSQRVSMNQLCVAVLEQAESELKQEATP